jgi:hypothetical protein
MAGRKGFSETPPFFHIFHIHFPDDDDGEPGGNERWFRAYGGGGGYNATSNTSLAPNYWLSVAAYVGGDGFGGGLNGYRVIGMPNEFNEAQVPFEDSDWLYPADIGTLKDDDPNIPGDQAVRATCSISGGGSITASSTLGGSTATATASFEGVIILAPNGDMPDPPYVYDRTELDPNMPQQECLKWYRVYYKQPPPPPPPPPPP